MKDILTSLRLVALSLLVCSVLYTAVLLGFGQAVAPARAGGSLVRDGSGAIVGSVQIAQEFTNPRYFWPRPSAVGYNASATGGSNLSPANPALAERAPSILVQHELEAGEHIPADLITTSGSGMDPHITVAAARFQARRVAVARRMPIEAVHRLIEQNTSGSSLKWLGAEPVVNVLLLNLELDANRGS
jgi:K+-transporting ATPase ATPase C chain